MHALVKGAIAASLLSVTGIVLRTPSATPAPRAASASAQPSAPALVEMPCAARHLPEGEACLPLPALASAPSEASFRERQGRGPAFDVLPRRPDRPADPNALRYPLPGEPLLLRGFDEASGGDVSPMALELSAERGAAVSALTLDGQVGPTRVVGLGRLVGNTVVTAHTSSDAGRSRTILLVHGHLDATGPDITLGTELAPGASLGFVGDSGNPGFVSLYLEARLVRDDVETLDKLDLKRLTDASVSIPTDARNVLPLVAP